MMVMMPTQRLQRGRLMSLTTDLGVTDYNIEELYCFNFMAYFQKDVENELEPFCRLR